MRMINGKDTIVAGRQLFEWFDRLLWGRSVAGGRMRVGARGVCK